MLNRKGTTIVELIISIALLSIVLAFMLKLLVDLNNARTNTTFAKENQIIRTEIIRTIENDIKTKTITSIDNNKKSTDPKDYISIKFSFSDNSVSYLKADTTTLTYTRTDGSERKWKMKDCTIYTDKVYFNKYLPLEDAGTSYGFVMYIQIFTINNENNDKKNNPLDDIQISYFNNNYDDYYIPDSIPQ